MDSLNVKSFKNFQNQTGIFEQFSSTQNPQHFLTPQISLENGKTENKDFHSQKHGIRLNSGKEIIGSGAAMRKVAERIAQVANFDSTVLLCGETGTGKELIAQALHDFSARHNKPIIKVNCAALPANLIESELFGHERGSFTGASGRRVGKFELADHGTLFLDEISEMPLELQVKILRAIQEKEIERVGGRTVIKTDVRIIAATNRNLQEETNAGRFRLDLFYRLNVFPVTLPPLRERREDIPALANHFAEKYSKKFRREMCRVSDRALQKLTNYNFPGNVREMENLIERSILMCEGTIIREIQLPVSENESCEYNIKDARLKTYEENERDHIMLALDRCNGKVSGYGGAAEALELNVSTLKSKIKKLNIKKEYF